MNRTALRVPDFNIDEFLERLLSLYRGKRQNARIHEEDIIALCDLAQDSFLEQPTLLELESPLNICGDIHGQYHDLLHLFELGGFPPFRRYLFLGDYVDRGRNSLEVICLLMVYKVKYPNSFFILRGNHESLKPTRKYGFYDECRDRLGINYYDLYHRFIQTFDYIPLAGVVNGKYFCCHGGLSPDLDNLQQIREIQRPICVPREGLVCDLLWSDPDTKVKRWELGNKVKTNWKHRGKGYLFGVDVLTEFLDRNGLDLVIRAHDCKQNGYEYLLDDKIVTVFSAPNYDGDINFAAIMRIGKGVDGRISFKRFI